MRASRPAARLRCPPRERPARWHSLAGSAAPNRSRRTANRWWGLHEPVNWLVETLRPRTLGRPARDKSRPQHWSHCARGPGKYQLEATRRIPAAPSRPHAERACQRARRGGRPARAHLGAVGVTDVLGHSVPCCPSPSPTAPAHLQGSSGRQHMGSLQSFGLPRGPQTCPNYSAKSAFPRLSSMSLGNCFGVSTMSSG